MRHLPVMQAEVLELLAPVVGETWVDCTIGAGGHAQLIVERIAPKGRLVGLDRDAGMLDLARPRFAGLPVSLVHAGFDELTDVLASRSITGVDGILADLGICSDQLDDPTRGLSFQQDGPLDMRMDQSSGPTAADLLARLSEREIADMIFEYGEERHSRRIARKIVEARRTEPLRTTSQLADLVRSCMRRSPGIDSATRTFQALRIAVNEELQALESLLKVLPRIVRPDGRAGFISFHSLEDRRVKHAFRDAAIWEVKTKKPVQAGEEEERRNPRSRSAKLRVAVRK